jgi:alginate O-acetyltransferase complex protein AlgI
MLFNSSEFLFIFLPLVLLTFYFSKNKYKIYVIGLSSIIFYYFSGLVAGHMLLLVTLLCFLLFNLSNKFFFYLSIITPLFILIVYKYYDFFFSNFLESFQINSLRKQNLPVFLQIVLPAGISFYTFQIISFLVDNKNNRDKVKFSEFFAYITFFPQLIAGPIVRWHEIKFQLQNIKENKYIINFYEAIKFFTIGLFLKIFIADICGKFSSDYYKSFKFLISENSKINLFDYIIYNFYFTFQIYFDFFSYSIMAIGLAYLFGIKLPKNFNEPYRSKNIKEFWRNWHITLSFWVRDYVYIPLGGYKFYIRNIIVIFLIMGLWHGASSNFLIWGLFHAFFVILYKLSQSWWDKQAVYLQITFTFLIVSAAWPLFDLSIKEIIYIFKNFTIDSTSFVFTSFFFIKKIIFIFYFFLLIFITFILNISENLYNDLKSTKIKLLIFSSIFLLCVIFINFTTTFIYFRF